VPETRLGHEWQVPARLWIFSVIACAFLARTVNASAGLSGNCEVIVSVRHQLLTLVRGNQRLSEYKISTSKFGVGDQRGSYRTPTGVFQIDRKVGDGAPSGAVFKSLRRTGEVLPPNARGRDPIVKRVLCLRGLETRNGESAARGIFIHGTPEEKRIGEPASYGCIRMRSRDVIALFQQVPVGTRVIITAEPLVGERDGALARAQGESVGAEWFR